MPDYVYRAESLARLLKAKEPLLRLDRHFGPPHDYPQKLLETVRKQLPANRAVYRLECQTRMPRQNGADTVLLRIPVRNAFFAEVTRIPDERNQSSGVVYFGVDDAVSPTNRISPRLGIPYEKVDVKVGSVWLPLSKDVVERLVANPLPPAEPLSA